MDWFTCTDATCPFETNSPRESVKHTEEKGHVVTSDWSRRVDLEDDAEYIQSYDEEEDG